MPILVGLSCDVPPGTFLTKFHVMFLIGTWSLWWPIVLMVSRRRFADTGVSYIPVVPPAIVWPGILGTCVATQCWFGNVLRCMQAQTVDCWGSALFQSAI